MSANEKLLRPFFSYYGSRYRLAKHYPPPMYSEVIEPFAGAAGYSTYYARDLSKVSLFDVDPVVCGVWDYLIRVPVSELKRLPIDVVSISELGDEIPQEAKWLIGFGLGAANASPRLTRTSSVTTEIYRKGFITANFWGPRGLDKLIRQVPLIRNWTIQNKSYTDIAVDSRRVTWFVDPPFVAMGRHYKFGSQQIDYNNLACFCRSLPGQTIVCEEASAGWLPFTPLLLQKRSGIRNTQHQDGVFVREC